MEAATLDAPSPRPASCSRREAPARSPKAFLDTRPAGTTLPSLVGTAPEMLVRRMRNAR